MTTTATILALERVKGLARLVLAATLGLAFLLGPPRAAPFYPLAGFIFVIYFLFAIAVLVFRQHLVARHWRLATLAGDVAVLVVILLLAPHLPAAFLVFFVYFTVLAGLWRGRWAAGALSLAVSLAYLALTWRGEEFPALRVYFSTLPQHWTMVLGLLAAGGLLGTVAERERRNIERTTIVGGFADLLRLDLGWPELWRRWLAEICRRYACGRALLVYRNPENDRVLLWDFRRRQELGGDLEETDRPPRDLHVFLLDRTAPALIANELIRHPVATYVPPGSGGEKPSLPSRFLEEFSARSLLSLPLAVGDGGGRLFLLDSLRAGFSPEQLDDLRALLAALSPSLTNLLTIRSLITRSVDLERERIVRELHDGVAQTLASVEMRLDVHRRQATADPARTADELAALKSLVKQEQDELRRFLRTLKPVRVSGQELGRWMLAHAAQFQQETGIQVEVDTQPVGASLPEGVCREVFQVFREALHNVRKHAGAHRVMVMLRQDEAFLRLLVDDDGRGFPFTGTYSQPALEKTGLGPVSICERIRALGGVLTIESAPGSGASLRVEIPLS